MGDALGETPIAFRVVWMVPLSKRTPTSIILNLFAGMSCKQKKNAG
jgi:hypothetical protein